MVKVLLKQKSNKDKNKWVQKELYFDGYIKSNLDLGVDQLKNDFDQVWFIDGAEGAGKSDLMIQLAYYVNKPETRHTLIDRICLTPEDFEKAISKAEKYEAVGLDEAFSGMSSSGTLSKINRVLQRKFTEIRAKNLFIFIVAPSFMDIMRYFAIWRSKCLIHVYLGKNRARGFAAFYGEKKKRVLYMLGKRNFYNYSCVKPLFVFRYIKQLHKVIDKEKYDIKKNCIVSPNEDELRLQKLTTQKKILLKNVIKNLVESNSKISNQQIGKIINLTKGTVGIYRREMDKKEGE